MDALPMIVPFAALGAAILVGLGVLVGRATARSGRRAAEELEAELSRAEAQSREQTRSVARLRTEQRSISNLARSLPNVVRELNRYDLEPRAIPDLLIQLTDALFEPDQVLLYLLRSPGEEGKPVELHLRTHSGLREVPDCLKRIPIGSGKIGWVAQHRVEMLADDWLNLTRTEGRSVEDNHPSLRLDMIAPLVQHRGFKEQILGVLCVGRPTVRPREEKLMLQVVTNLGSLALMSAMNFQKLREQAHHDGLTGLFNKTHFMRELGLLINHAERHAQRVGLFIFDIDHFKNYNDANGHLAGDELLKGMARLVKENLRPEDMACRYGGEEFVVAMPETDADTAFQIAERLREVIAAHAFPHEENQPQGRLTISGGVSTFPVDGTNSTDLIRNADHALYQAKAAGRNRVIRYRGVEIGDASRHDDDLYSPGASTVAAEGP